jgi:hypothetical protein
VALVLGSYCAAQYVRVWRPRRRGERSARPAEEPPASAGAGRTQPAVSGGRAQPMF